MQLQEITLHNYKVHRNKTYTFQPGVVGIVGDNGTGKSSIISAICFLYTGEVDEDKKSECITLGETEGWVKGKFLLNGKEGTLERHLTGSKVSLTYDGVTYNKVAEVDQLWNDLLQIDRTIFNNVIVAKQGEIQNLFSDETTVREKIFQKIFMVPPTEKIRNTILDNYIKVCPPEKPEEDVQVLITMQSHVASERNKALAEIDESTANQVSPSTLQCLVDKISYLEKCIQDSQKKPGLEEKLGEYLIESENDRNHLVVLGNALELLPDNNELQNTKNRMLEMKSDFTRKQSILNEIAVLDKTIDIHAAELNRSKLAECEIFKDDYYTNLTEGNTELKGVIAQKNHLLQLRGHAKCPTCHQDIPNSEETIKSLMAQEVNLNALISKFNASYQGVLKQIQTLQSALAKHEALITRRQYLQDECDKLGDVEYSDQAYTKVCEQIATREGILQQIREKNSRQTEISAEIRVLEEKVRSLTTYTGESTAEADLEMLRAGLEGYNNIKENISRLQVVAAKLEHELLLLDTRITTSQVNSKYNAKRRTYLERLDKLYKLFAVNKFPRQLIKSYMDTVQASLSTYLSYFDIKYTVRVVDGFKIRLYNGHDGPLPSVSGGQEIMIGICLRLALHKMFAQSFPIWIIDEGSNHLSEAKRQNYFELIDTLRKQRVINQIIVIDHDERLSAVVDQSIEL